MAVLFGFTKLSQMEKMRSVLSQLNKIQRLKMRFRETCIIEIDGYLSLLEKQLLT